eukprot:7470281-Pyramimonas_sp.AAC.1
MTTTTASFSAGWKAAHTRSGAPRSGVDRPPTLTRRLRNWPLSVRERASRPSPLRVQVRRFRSQAVFTKG